ncbi:MAG: hypothetical protein IJ411_00635 [Oscillospiraceae bacterium]|nr:hypothetical protein [Oscillospiraceae bacterium]
MYNTLNNRQKKQEEQAIDLRAKSTMPVDLRMETQSSGSKATADGSNQQQYQQQNQQSQTQYDYDESSNAAYQQAMAALEQAKQAAPTYAGTYDQQILDLYNQITNRPKFSYDLNADALYNQYKDQYTQQGRLAMMDTMGQAAALTGGYGSSYGQNVGQQAYQGYLQGLNDIVPELYGRAYDRYSQEGQDMMNRYGMLGALRDEEYGRYQDQMNQYWQNLNYLQSQADSAYERGYNDWYTNMQMQYQQERDAIADQQWQTEFDENKRRYDQEWAESQKSSGGSGGGSSRSSATALSDSQQKELLARFDDGGINSAERYLSLLVANGNLDEEAAVNILTALLDEMDGQTDTTVRNTGGSDGASSYFAGNRKWALDMNR